MVAILLIPCLALSSVPGFAGAVNPQPRFPYESSILFNAQALAAPFVGTGGSEPLENPRIRSGEIKVLGMRPGTKLANRFAELLKILERAYSANDHDVIAGVKAELVELLHDKVPLEEEKRPFMQTLIRGLEDAIDTLSPVVTPEGLFAAILNELKRSGAIETSQRQFIEDHLQVAGGLALTNFFMGLRRTISDVQVWKPRGDLYKGPLINAHNQIVKGLLDGVMRARAKIFRAKKAHLILGGKAGARQSHGDWNISMLEGGGWLAMIPDGSDHANDATQDLSRPAEDWGALVPNALLEEVGTRPFDLLYRSLENPDALRQILKELDRDWNKPQFQELASRPIYEVSPPNIPKPYFILRQYLWILATYINSAAISVANDDLLKHLEQAKVALEQIPGTWLDRSGELPSLPLLRRIIRDDNSDLAPNETEQHPIVVSVAALMARIPAKLRPLVNRVHEPEFHGVYADALQKLLFRLSRRTLKDPGVIRQILQHIELLNDPVRGLLFLVLANRLSAYDVQGGEIPNYIEERGNVIGGFAMGLFAEFVIGGLLSLAVGTGLVLVIAMVATVLAAAITLPLHYRYHLRGWTLQGFEMIPDLERYLPPSHLHVDNLPATELGRLMAEWLAGEGHRNQYHWSIGADEEPHYQKIRDAKVPPPALPAPEKGIVKDEQGQDLPETSILLGVVVAVIAAFFIPSWSHALAAGGLSAIMIGAAITGGSSSEESSGRELVPQNQNIPAYLIERFTTGPFELMALKLGWENVLKIVHELDLYWNDPMFQEAVSQGMPAFSTLLIPDAYLDLRGYLKMLPAYVHFDHEIDHEEVEKIIGDGALALEKIPGSLLPMSSGLPSAFLLMRLAVDDNADLVHPDGQKIPRSLLPMLSHVHDSNLHEVYKKTLEALLVRLKSRGLLRREMIDRIAEYADGFLDPAKGLFFLILANRLAGHNLAHYLHRKIIDEWMNQIMPLPLITVSVTGAFGAAFVSNILSTYHLILPISGLIELIAAGLAANVVPFTWYTLRRRRAFDQAWLEAGFEMIRDLADHLPSRFLRADAIRTADLIRMMGEWVGKHSMYQWYVDGNGKLHYTAVISPAGWTPLLPHARLTETAA